MKKEKKKDKPSPLPMEEDACQIDRERYRVFIEDVADGYYETNVNGDFVFFNEAFCRIFRFTVNELQDRNYKEFMDENNAKSAYENFNRVYQTGEGFTDIIWEVKRKDGVSRILKISASLITDENGQKTGCRGIARDVTREKRAARSNQTLFRIAKALPHYRRLDQLLKFIIREVQDLIGVEGASVILLDEDKQEFYFPAATYDDAETGEKMQEIRFPVNTGVAGHVYKTGEPMIVPDTSKSPYFFQQVDVQSKYRTRNMLDVPIKHQERTIGVLCAVNKKDRDFDQADVFLLNTIASTVALPIENARINDELKRSYEDVKSFNRAKDKVIHHLSHELKTPVSVLTASLSLLSRKISGIEGQAAGQRILRRMQRNLQRLLEMQYEIEDILRQRDYKSYNLLSTLLDVCTDELEALVTEKLCEDDIVEKIRNRIEELFGPRDVKPQKVKLDEFVNTFFQAPPRFSHRTCRLQTQVSPVAPILIPPEVLTKILEGLIRNAVENTPDGGRIEVSVRESESGPELEVKDFGIGITEENQRLIFESNFTANETMNYSSGKHYDFGAGGKGFDLLRMKIFSERYQFKIQMTSKRCGYIPKDEDLCPGNIEDCTHCKSVNDCLQSGGTTIIVRFSAAAGTDAKQENGIL
ncbi:MAG: GAF domain-containing protein [Deltaproteobacteria bacterium]|nr:GAF domain-containing protein [Deltaproteobacteria bacterium]